MAIPQREIDTERAYSECVTQLGHDTYIPPEGYKCTVCGWEGHNFCCPTCQTPLHLLEKSCFIEENDNGK